MLDENTTFDAWKNASTEEKPKYLSHLIKLLRNHAYAVSVPILQERKDDLVNEAVWLALDKSASFRGDSLFSTWFQRIVINLCNKALNDRRKNKNESLEDISSSSGLEESIVVRDALQSLTKRQRIVIELLMQGLTYRDIAAKLEISRGGVEGIIKTVRQRMQQLGWGNGNFAGK